MMNKYEELACRIIERIEEVIEANYPNIKPKHITSDNSIDNPALINGTTYYNLEQEIATMIKEIKK